MLAWIGRSEVPCNHVVNLAKAEVNGNPAASALMRQFANVSENDAEQGCHRVFRQHGYCAPVPVVRVDLGRGDGCLKTFPYIPLSGWLQWLLDRDRIWRQLCGCSSWDVMTREVLPEFWRRFKSIYPTHSIFDSKTDRQLSRTIPVFSHTDEGRSFKKDALWLLSTAGCLGRGSQAWVDLDGHLAPLDQCGFGLNFLGATWSTQFFFCSILRSVVKENERVLNDIVAIYAKDLAFLFETGLTSSDGRKRIYVAHLANKGDLPALAKLGGLTRTFAHVPRGGASRAAAKGICHMCLAGQEQDDSKGKKAYPYEDFALKPAWLETMHVEEAWQSTPEILRGAPLVPTERASFFAVDVFHNVHLGIAKHWIASSLVSVIERMDLDWGYSVDSKFEYLTAVFRTFCRENRITPHFTQLSRETVGWPSSRTVPIGQWSKGSMSTHLMRFLEFFMSQKLGPDDADEVLRCIELRR